MDSARVADTPARSVDSGQTSIGGRYQLGDRTCRAYIVLGIGNDDTLDTLAESEHDTQQQARVWVEEILPRTAFPDWVAARRHGTAGAYLYGGVLWGRYILDVPDDDRGGDDCKDNDRGVNDGGGSAVVDVAGEALTWEPDVDQPCVDAELVNGGVIWVEYGWA